MEHRCLPILTPQQMNRELGEDRAVLEKITGKLVSGLSYAYGNWSESVKQAARLNGFKYSRTTRATGRFFPPEDFLEWHPTCHSENLIELGKQFLNVPDFYELPLMYVWGHSYEFGIPNDWSLMEKFASMMFKKEDTWYAGSLEICEYILAVRAQEFSADGRKMRNPTALSVWVASDGGVMEVHSGETVHLEE